MIKHINQRRRHLAIVASVVLSCATMPVLAHAAIPQEALSDSQDGAHLVRVDAPASYLGVNIRDIDEHSARMLGLKSSQGVEVIAVDHDAPAGKAGIHLRDVIVTVDGKPVTSAAQFRATMRGYPAGREVTLNILREGKPMKFVIKLADRAKLEHQAWLQHFSVPMPEVGNSFSSVVALQNALAGGTAGDDASPDQPQFLLSEPFRIGAELDPIGPQLAAFFGVKDGTGMLVKSVEQGGPAAAAGLQAGDVVLKLNEVTIVSALDWMRGMQTAQGKPIQITIVRNKRVEVLTITPARTQAQLDWPQMESLKVPPMPQVNIPDFHIDQAAMQAQMEAMQTAFKASQAVNEETIQKAIADAQAHMPDMTALQSQVNQELTRSGVLKNGQLSEKIQQQMRDSMQKATQQLQQLQLDCCSNLLPY